MKQVEPEFSQYLQRASASFELEKTLKSSSLSFSLFFFLFFSRIRIRYFLLLSKPQPIIKYLFTLLVFRENFFWAAQKRYKDESR